ncbi:MAG TPA: saccharopine dehydrogenase NADP-binding domain-containing protein [Phototrophicaceae bacterium]|nr:saccharopine dehydrogenase NADP-binding domain-containing protein [Phototrophicaceae bacterium]
MTAKIVFGGRVLVLGVGSVSRCFLPLLLRHFDMDFAKVTVMDFEDLRPLIPDVLAAGVQYVQHRVTPDDLAETLNRYVGEGDLVVDLAWNIDTGEMVQWCHDHQVLYINTSVEMWDPYADIENKPPAERTLYVRHMALRKMAKRWSEPGPTAVVEHGANPGLVSHWTKVALEDIARAIIDDEYLASRRRAALEHALNTANYARLAMLTGTKVIHISERDTQITDQPKRVGEFVNTWSIAGFHEEGIAPAEMGWGTHERRLPPLAQKHNYGPGNQICLSQMGMNTLVRSWVPSGEIMGMVVRHGEAFTLSDYLTVWDGDVPVYRPTVHYAYLPCDAAIASLHELKMNGYELQYDQRILGDEIIDGQDELGVLLLGHDLNGWWVGSQLDIHEARRLVPGQNATTLQVAASVLGALDWMIRNPRAGLKVPDQLPHREVLAVANPYLGPSVSIETDWNPLKNRFDPFANWGQPAPDEADLWQFETFLVR